MSIFIFYSIGKKTKEEKLQNDRKTREQENDRMNIKFNQRR